MSFKEYWQQHFNKDIQKTSSLENACRYVFNDQQAKIEALEAELAKEREIVNDVCELDSKDALNQASRLRYAARKIIRERREIKG